MTAAADARAKGVMGRRSATPSTTPPPATPVRCRSRHGHLPARFMGWPPFPLSDHARIEDFPHEGVAWPLVQAKPFLSEKLLQPTLKHEQHWDSPIAQHISFPPIHRSSPWRPDCMEFRLGLILHQYGVLSRSCQCRTRPRPSPETRPRTIQRRCSCQGGRLCIQRRAEVPRTEQKMCSTVPVHASEKACRQPMHATTQVRAGYEL